MPQTNINDFNPLFAKLSLLLFYFLWGGGWWDFLSLLTKEITSNIYFYNSRDIENVYVKDISLKFTVYAVGSASNGAFTWISILGYQDLRMLSYTNSINTILTCDLRTYISLYQITNKVRKSG